MMNYDKMIACIEPYHASIPKLSAQKPETIAHTLSLLTDDYEVRFGDVPLFETGEGMINGMAFENDEVWVTYVLQDGPEYYWIVDERQGMLAGLFREELRHPKTGEILRAVLNFTHVWFREVDGEPKMCKEHLVEVPAKIRVDALTDIE